jgi:hypothetical protein
MVDADEVDESMDREAPQDEWVRFPHPVRFVLDHAWREHDLALALGDRRARSVIDHLGRLGTDPERLRAVSRGKLDATGADEAGWAKDRRAEFIWE